MQTKREISLDTEIRDSNFFRLKPENKLTSLPYCSDQYREATEYVVEKEGGRNSVRGIDASNVHLNRGDIIYSQIYKNLDTCM